jgi:RND superfamily putative drug exporter
LALNISPEKLASATARHAGITVGVWVVAVLVAIGLAVAVALDATIVVSVLVPATMRRLGDRNWYLPAWLRWLPEFRTD